MSGLMRHVPLPRLFRLLHDKLLCHHKLVCFFQPFNAIHELREGYGKAMVYPQYTDYSN
jgi:hypothetical protein